MGLVCDLVFDRGLNWRGIRTSGRAQLITGKWECSGWSNEAIKFHCAIDVGREGASFECWINSRPDFIARRRADCLLSVTCDTNSKSVCSCISGSWLDAVCRVSVERITPLWTGGSQQIYQQVWQQATEWTLVIRATSDFWTTSHLFRLLWIKHGPAGGAGGGAGATYFGGQRRIRFVEKRPRRWFEPLPQR